MNLCRSPVNYWVLLVYWGPLSCFTSWMRSRLIYYPCIVSNINTALDMAAQGCFFPFNGALSFCVNSFCYFSFHWFVLHTNCIALTYWKRNAMGPLTNKSVNPIALKLYLQMWLNLFCPCNAGQWYLMCSSFPKVKACDGSLVPVNHYCGRDEHSVDRPSEKFGAVL